MSLDWVGMFGISIHPVELFVRGSAVYWFLFAIFRLVLRRDVGAIGIADVLLLVLIADAAQNAMAGEYTSITEGFILVATIIGWNVLIDALAYRFPAVRRLVQPQELMLVRNGQILHRNLRRELITVEELLGKLRQQGVEELRDVRAAYIESDGGVSVIRHRRADAQPPAERPTKRPA